MLDLRSLLYDEIAQEVEAIVFPGVSFGSTEVSGEMIIRWEVDRKVQAGHLAH